MLRFSTLAALFLVALWLPATVHCRLEGLGFEAFFSCASEEAHTDGVECSDDGCKTIESGQFALSKSRVSPAGLPSFTCWCASGFLQVPPPAPVSAIFPSRENETLPFRRTWQFARRAALPARAPDALIA